VFTDGDLRRALDARMDLNETPISQLMTLGAQTIAPGMLAAEALHIMDEHKITSLVVLENQQIAGVVHLLSLLKAGIA
jgi:arabinose-5-phosphate isomerase